VEKLASDLTPLPPSLEGKGEKSKPLSYKERGLERGLSDAVKSQIDFDRLQAFRSPTSLRSRGSMTYHNLRGGLVGEELYFFGDVKG
jgi:hypothetical protein